jgi:tetratricopeptide (TPR) repeat protein
MKATRRIALLAAPLLLSAGVTLAANNDPTVDCLNGDNERRIRGCTALIETPDLPQEQRSLAYGLRALAYSLRGMFERALGDYDMAISLKPDFSVALNNRAWAYFKLGRASEGADDVERALELSPGSPFAFDTRAHIRQAEGDTNAALADYERAMQHGGDRIVRLYQCGLRGQGLYFGGIDGVHTPSLSRALRVCVGNRFCDPLPADEECRPSVS